MYICVTVQVTAYIYIYIYLLLSTCTRVSFLIKFQPETLQLSESRDSATDVFL